MNCIKSLQEEKELKNKKKIQSLKQEEDNSLQKEKVRMVQIYAPVTIVG